MLVSILYPRGYGLHVADAKSKDQMVEELVDRLVFVLNNIDSQ